MLHKQELEQLGSEPTTSFISVCFWDSEENYKFVIFVKPTAERGKGSLPHKPIEILELV